MVLVYFIRHAETDTSVKEDAYRPLTKKGEADSLLVTKALKQKGIVCLYSSPYQRTRDTIKDLAHTLSLEPILLPALRERSIGTWVEDFFSFAQKQWACKDFKLPGGESLLETQERNIAALKEILKTHEGQSVGISTHGTALSTLLDFYLLDFGYQGFLELLPKMPYILKATFEEGRLLQIEEIPF